MRTTLRLTATAAAAVTKSDEGKQLDDYHKEMHYTVDSYHTRHTTRCIPVRRIAWPALRPLVSAGTLSIGVAISDEMRDEMR